MNDDDHHDHDHDDNKKNAELCLGSGAEINDLENAEDLALGKVLVLVCAHQWVVHLPGGSCHFHNHESAHFSMACFRIRSIETQGDLNPRSSNLDPRPGTNMGFRV